MKAQLMRHQVPLLFQQTFLSADEGEGVIISYQRTAFLEESIPTRGGLTHLLQGRGGKKVLGEPFGAAKDALISAVTSPSEHRSPAEE